jgi:hypothetical protein
LSLVELPLAEALGFALAEALLRLFLLPISFALIWIQCVSEILERFREILDLLPREIFKSPLQIVFKLRSSFDPDFAPCISQLHKSFLPAPRGDRAPDPLVAFQPVQEARDG